MTPCKNCWFKLPSGKPTRQGTSPIVQEEQELQMGDGHSGEMTIQLLLFARSNSHFLKLNSAFLPLAFRFFCGIFHEQSAKFIMMIIQFLIIKHDSTSIHH
jgi:hypothetical protein